MNRFESQYKSFWANAKVDKKKGSGIGILIENKWEKHIGNIERINEFILIVKLYFKQMQLIIGVVYLPPNDKDLCKLIQRKLVEIVNANRQTAQIIFMGDFNFVVDSTLDRKNKRIHTRKGLPLFK